MKISNTININKLFNDDNKTKLIGLLVILIIIWTILYLIPGLFVALFNTLLGNMILLLSVLLLYTKDKMYAIGLGILCIILYRFSQMSMSKLKEGFTKESELTYLTIQNTINRQKVFDIEVMGTQATQEELDYFNQHGMWPWSQDVIKLYEDAVKRNPYVRSITGDSTIMARKTYNQNAILRVLSYQTKEGQFLLDGISIFNPDNEAEKLPSGFGDFGYNSGLLENKQYDTIRCNLAGSGEPQMERITYTGRGILGQQTSKVRPVSNDQLEKLIPGFSFKGTPCNPCKSMSEIPDYSCPFQLKTKDDSNISNVWKYLWKL